MENLWAPWRMTYIGGLEDQDGCFLCRALAGEPRESLVVWKNDVTFCVLNRFPYNNGHLMITPVRHVGEVEALTPVELSSLMTEGVRAQKLLRRVVHAHGFNWGLNMGRCAGAGLVGHLHLHIVPRWEGDTNFMPIFADVKIIPQALEELYEKLVTAVQTQSPNLG